jgi:predicted secreted protein
MASAVQGKDCVFQMNITSGYKTVLCAKSFSLNVSADIVEITTYDDGTDPESGAWKDYDYDSLSYTISLEGVMKITDSTNDTVWEVLSVATQFVEADFRMIFTDAESNTKQIDGVVLVRSLSLSTTPNALVQQNIEFQGKGKFTVT